MLEKILLSDKPSNIIRANKKDIFELIPELKVCDGFNQYNDYHIYDVLEHILRVLDNIEGNYLLRIAALFHDIGKPNSFKLDDKGIGHFYGHWYESLKIFNKYANLFKLDYLEVVLIKNLIYYHDLEINEKNINMLKYIFKDNFELLLSLKKADILAQNPKYFNRLEELNSISNLTK